MVSYPGEKTVTTVYSWSESQSGFLQDEAKNLTKVWSFIRSLEVSFVKTKEFREGEAASVFELEMRELISG